MLFYITHYDGINIMFFVVVVFVPLYIYFHKIVRVSVVLTSFLRIKPQNKTKRKLTKTGKTTTMKLCTFAKKNNNNNNNNNIGKSNHNIEQ